MLKDEEDGDEEEVESTKIVFDSGGKFREVPDPEPTPIKANSSSDLESPMLNLPELERVRPESETRPLVKEIKPPDSTIVTGLSQLQEVPVEASIDAKETKSWPKPTTNPNPYTPPITPPNLNPSFLTFNLNTDPNNSKPITLPNTNPHTKTAQSGHQKLLTTPFLGENRRRSRPERLLLVISVENQARNRRCAVVPLSVFDPGGNGSFEEKGFAWLRFWWSFGHFGRIFGGDRRRVKASGRRFSERRRIRNEEDARISNDLIWRFWLIGISEDNCKNLGIFWKSFGKFGRILDENRRRIEEGDTGFVKEEDVLQSSCEMKGEAARVVSETKRSFYSIDVNSKRWRFERDLSWASWASWSTFWRTESNAQMGREGCIAFNKFFSFWRIRSSPDIGPLAIGFPSLANWVISRIGLIGPLLQLFSFQFLG
ncbi:hypothetical protein LWI29_016547 [Acer saccharum]|uniref:Uncharacterized protein n=1 Tax=Acer saccharum TaxID=4024 RepID=A0AA39TEP8_ACESA|nr:hypothetical protein LWI29_016547 [Acer saccharum]